jgi:hypothetical protein
MKRVRVEEFFRDFDKLRKGKVTVSQFKQILSMLNFSLSEEEFESLAGAFKTPPPDNMFNYFAFTAQVNEAFTVKGIDKNPNLSVKAMSSDDTYVARRKYLEMSEEEISDVKDITEEYRRAIKNRRINLKPQFQDFDITKNGHVTKT